jgi:hypothetical protein
VNGEMFFDDIAAREMIRRRLQHDNSLTLFDATIDGGPPRSRRSDPATSVVAAQTVTPGNGALIRRIRIVVRAYGPMTAFDIASFITDSIFQHDRWDSGTIRTAVSRAGLTVVGEGRSPRGRRCLTYGCPDG